MAEKKAAQEKDSKKTEDKVERPPSPAAKPYVCPGRMNAKWDDEKKAIFWIM